MDHYLTSNTNVDPASSATECIERMHSSISPSEIGYKIQALAAHVLCRLGHQVDEINRSGHPDVATFKDGVRFHFEVEAQVSGPRLRQLTKADFESLLGAPNLVGYYALALSSPTPRWILVPARKLVERKLASPNALLEALQERDLSAEWTHVYIALLHSSCREIRLTPFNELRQMALEGRWI